MISDIVASTTPELAARDLKQVLDSFQRAREIPHTRESRSVCQYYPRRLQLAASGAVEQLISGVADLMAVIREKTPLAHQVRVRSLRVACLGLTHRHD